MGNPDDERLKPHNKIDCEENIEGLFQQRTDVLGKCDIVRMLLESPNRDKHELHIINGKALVEKDIRWHERQKIKYEEIDDDLCGRFFSETIELVKKEKEKWKNLEKK